MKLLEKITGGYTSSAKVVDGALILSLPDAVSPVVWRMELEDVKAAALEIEAKDNVYILIMKEGKADKKEIAPYDSKTKAVKALMAASRALENAQSRSKANDNTSNSSSEKGNNAVSAIIAILILIVLIFAIVNMGPRVQTPTDLATGGASQTGAVPAQGSPGTPQSANDFLMGR